MKILFDEGWGGCYNSIIHSYIKYGRRSHHIILFTNHGFAVFPNEENE